MSISAQKQTHRHYRRAERCRQNDLAREFLPTDAELPNFVNADLIAAGLSPFAPDVAAFKAGRIMAGNDCGVREARRKLSFETTLPV